MYCQLYHADFHQKGKPPHSQLLNRAPLLLTRKERTPPRPITLWLVMVEPSLVSDVVVPVVVVVAHICCADRISYIISLHTEQSYIHGV